MENLVASVPHPLRAGASADKTEKDAAGDSE
jgi:hypothetical protein